MASELFNTLTGYSVGIPAVTVIDETGNVVSNFLNLTGNVTANNISSVTPEETETNVYPNPVKSSLYINSKDQIKSIKILSMNGVIIKTISMKSGSQSVDLSKLSKGIYIAEIITDKGSTQKKIVKQ